MRVSLCILSSGILRGYRVRVLNVETRMETVLSSDVTSITVNELDCCSDYTFSVAAATIDFGTQSPAISFRTYPDLTGENHAYCLYSSIAEQTIGFSVQNQLL